MSTHLGDHDATVHSMAKMKPNPPIIGKVTSNRIALYWDPRQFVLCDKEATCIYFVIQELDQTTGTFDTVYSGKQAEYSAQGLGARQQYKFRLRVCCSSWKSQWSPIVTVSTTAQDITAPELHRMAIYTKDDNIGEFEKCIDRKGVDVDARDQMGRTLLMKLCELGKVNMCKALLGRGAHVNATTESKKTPLMFACIGGHAAMVELLLSDTYKAEWDVVDRGGSSAVMYACDTGRVAVLRALRDGGANITSKDMRTKETALHRLGSISGNSPCAEFLVESGIDVNERDINGRTALMIATANNNIEMVRSLLSKGSRCTIASNSGVTALQIASGLGRKNIMELLSSYA